jgi:hypothetical protein
MLHGLGNGSFLDQVGLCLNHGVSVHYPSSMRLDWVTNPLEGGTRMASDITAQQV